jgi:hypothetical protein
MDKNAGRGLSERAIHPAFTEKIGTSTHQRRYRCGQKPQEMGNPAV